MDELEWDEWKRVTNLAKHGVDFADLGPVFEGSTLELLDNRRDYGEDRIICMGEAAGRVLVIVYTWRGPVRRIISARKANARETRAFSSFSG